MTDGRVVDVWCVDVVLLLIVLDEKCRKQHSTFTMERLKPLSKNQEAHAPWLLDASGGSQFLGLVIAICSTIPVKLVSLRHQPLLKIQLDLDVDLQSFLSEEHEVRGMSPSNQKASFC